jgi:hypothetical protein
MSPHTGTRGATDHQAKLNTLLDILLSTYLDLHRDYDQYRYLNVSIKRSSNPSVVLPGNAVVRKSQKGIAGKHGRINILRLVEKT